MSSLNNTQAVSSASLMHTLATCLKAAGVAVLRTDTLYGIVASATSMAAVERVYAAKRRTPSKSPIVLIGSIDQLFDTYDESVLVKLAELWPGPVSVILPSSQAPEWVRRDNQSVAYRLPAEADLRRLLQATGPLIAPSANPEGQPPATTITEARAYFGELVDVYADGGQVSGGKPSSLYRLLGGELEQLR